MTLSSAPFPPGTPRSRPHCPGSRTRSGLGLRCLLLVILALTIRADKAAGQVEGEARGDVVHGWVAAALGYSSFSDSPEILVGLFAGLEREGWRVGGGGWATADRIDLSEDLALGVGYGGIQLHRGISLSPILESGPTLFVGAGNAEVRSELQGIDLDADNFGVIEPGWEVRIQGGGALGLSVVAGYRWTFGVDPLPGVAEDALQGLTGVISLRLGRIP